MVRDARDLTHQDPDVLAALCDLKSQQLLNGRADAVILTVCVECLRKVPRHNVVGVLYAGEEGPFVGSGLPEILAALRLPRIDAGC